MRTGIEAVPAWGEQSGKVLFIFPDREKPPYTAALHIPVEEIDDAIYLIKKLSDFIKDKVEERESV